MLPDMGTLVLPFMNLKNSQSYVNGLYSSNEEKCLEAILYIKHSVIGSNRQKEHVISQGVVPRLLELLGDDDISNNIKTEAAITLGSLAKGTTDHVKSLVDLGLTSVFIKGLSNTDKKLTQAILCCLRTICQSPFVPNDLIYYNDDIVPSLLRAVPHSISNQLCVTIILRTTCQTSQDQNFLCAQGVVFTLATLLFSSCHDVQMSALQCLMAMCFENKHVSAIVASTSFRGKCMSDVLGGFMGRDKPNDMQITAAKCITYMFRAEALSEDNHTILYKTLPCLVCLLRKSQSYTEKRSAVNTLVCLIEMHTSLQRLASITDQFVLALNDLFKDTEVPNTSDSEKLAIQDLKLASLKALDLMASSGKEVRLKIMCTRLLIHRVTLHLKDPCCYIRLAALKFLTTLCQGTEEAVNRFQNDPGFQSLLEQLKESVNNFQVKVYTVPRESWDQSML